MAGRIYSESEAAAILESAARRQGVAEPGATVGLTLSELQSVATEAGIEARHVSAAIAELGSGEGTRRRVAGLQAEATRSVLLERPVSEEEWGRIVADLRREFGAVGVTSDVGMVRAWASAASESEVPVRASLEPEDIGARLTLTQRPGDIVGMLMMIGVGVFTMLGAGTMLFDDDSRIIGAAMLVAAAAIYFGVRRWYAGSLSGIERQFEAVLGRTSEMIATRGLEESAASPAPGLDLDSLPEPTSGKGPASRERERE